jgi:hypothetical protein
MIKLRSSKRDAKLRKFWKKKCDTSKLLLKIAAIFVLWGVLLGAELWNFSPELL